MIQIPQKCSKCVYCLNILQLNIILKGNKQRNEKFNVVFNVHLICKLSTRVKYVFLCYQFFYFKILKTQSIFPNEYYMRTFPSPILTQNNNIFYVIQLYFSIYFFVLGGLPYFFKALFTTCIILFLLVYITDYSIPCIMRVHIMYNENCTRSFWVTRKK